MEHDCPQHPTLSSPLSEGEVRSWPVYAVWATLARDHGNHVVDTTPVVLEQTTAQEEALLRQLSLDALHEAYGVDCSAHEAPRTQAEQRSTFRAYRSAWVRLDDAVWLLLYPGVSLTAATAVLEVSRKLGLYWLSAAANYGPFEEFLMDYSPEAYLMGDRLRENLREIARGYPQLAPLFYVGCYGGVAANGPSPEEAVETAKQNALAPYLAE